jgi:hypothetical protein
MPPPVTALANARWVLAPRVLHSPVIKLPAAPWSTHASACLRLLLPAAVCLAKPASKCCAPLAGCRVSAAGTALPAQPLGTCEVFLTELEKAEILRVWESKVRRAMLLYSQC